jgi:sugar phosphate isomerase/epimerase
MMGDGVIELRRLRESVERAGWSGPIEVEIFNETVWNTPIDELLPRLKERFLSCV